MAVSTVEIRLTSACIITQTYSCLLYTSDAADERSSVDLGGRRIIKKKKTIKKVMQMRLNLKITSTHYVDDHLSWYKTEKLKEED